MFVYFNIISTLGDVFNSNYNLTGVNLNDSCSGNFTNHMEFPYNKLSFYLKMIGIYSRMG